MDPNDKENKMKISFNDIIRKIYSLKAEEEIAAIDVRNKKANEVKDIYVKKIDETEAKYMQMIIEIYQSFDDYLVKHRNESEENLAMQSELLIYVEDWLIPLLAKNEEEAEIQDEKFKSDLNLKETAHFIRLRNKLEELKQEFGQDSEEVNKFTKCLQDKHTLVMDKWKSMKDGDNQTSQMLQEIMDNLHAKLVEYNLPLPRTDGAVVPPATPAPVVNKQEAKLDDFKPSSSKAIVECQPSTSKKVDDCKLANTQVIHDAQNEETDNNKKTAKVKRSRAMSKEVTTTITAVPMNISLDESQLSMRSSGSRRRALAELNRQQEDTVLPKTCFKKAKLAKDQNIQTVEEKEVKCVNFNLSKPIEDSDPSGAFFIPLSDNKSERFNKENDNNEEDNNNQSTQIEFGSAVFDANTSFNFDFGADDNISLNFDGSYDFAGFNITDGDNNSLEGFKF